MPDLISGFRVGIDVGGTKTHVRAVVDAEAGPDGLLADRVYSSQDWVPADHRRAAAFLADLILETLPGTPASALCAVAVGAHGCDSAADGIGLRTELTRLLNVPCLVVNDAELLVPAMGLTDGIGLVAGTGSVAVGRDSDGEPVYVGGWGWLFGDEGSAPGLLREAARASLAARDRGEPPDLLATLLLASFDVAEVTDLPDAMAADSGARQWGGRAELVFDALAGGSAPAGTVIDDAAGSLAGLVAQVAARGVAADDVVVAGGVILNQPSLYQGFTRRLANVLPEARVHRLSAPPVHGAVLLAERLARSQAAVR